MNTAISYIRENCKPCTDIQFLAMCQDARDNDKTVDVTINCGGLTVTAYRLNSDNINYNGKDLLISTGDNLIDLVGIEESLTGEGYCYFIRDNCLVIVNFND